MLRLMDRVRGLVWERVPAPRRGLIVTRWETPVSVGHANGVSRNGDAPVRPSAATAPAYPMREQVHGGTHRGTTPQGGELGAR